LDVCGIDRLPISEILRIVEEHGGLNPRVFGSRARGEAREDSDLDLLIKGGPTMSLLDVAGIQVKVEQLLGIPVQVVTEGALHPLLRQNILSEAKPLVAQKRTSIP
jgi:predicted nucleotidyltransferase